MDTFIKVIFVTYFPQKMQILILYIFRRDVEPAPGAFVCSCHFREGKNENGPQIFLHNISNWSLFLTSTLEKKTRTTKKKLNQ